MGKERLRKVLAALAVALVAACASQPRSSNPPESGGDAALSAKVKTAIATDVGARAASSVSVETYRGVVSLSGFADSEERATRAAEAAKKVQGVRSVKNDIRIKSS